MSTQSKSTLEPSQPPQAPSRRPTEFIVFAALVAFLPIPFVIPFWAAALVPISYLVCSFGVGGLVYGLVCATILFGVAKLLCRLIYLARERTTRIRWATALVLILFVMSLLPIYKPGLDPPTAGVNIIGLFRAGIPLGQ